MLIQETFRVNCPIERLFDFFLDVEAVGPCIPGCEKIAPLGEKEYESIIKAKVGIVSVKFKIRTLIEESVPCNLIRTVGEGNEFKKLGHFRQKTEVKLKELSETETEVSYQSEVSIVGRLATFGDRLLRSKAKELGKEFADAVKNKMG